MSVKLAIVRHAKSILNMREKLKLEMYQKEYIENDKENLHLKKQKNIFFYVQTWSKIKVQLFHQMKFHNQQNEMDIAKRNQKQNKEITGCCRCPQKYLAKTNPISTPKMHTNDSIN